MWPYFVAPVTLFDQCTRDSLTEAIKAARPLSLSISWSNASFYILSPPSILILVLKRKQFLFSLQNKNNFITDWFPANVCLIWEFSPSSSMHHLAVNAHTPCVPSLLFLALSIFSPVTIFSLVNVFHFIALPLPDASCGGRAAPFPSFRPGGKS